MKLTEGAEAALVLPREALAGARLAGHGSAGLLAAHGRLLVSAGDRPFLAGRFEALSPGELLGLASSGLRTGELVARAGERQTRLQFHDGEIVGGGSSQRQHRLGRVLVELGWVLVSALAEVEPLVTPERRLGRLRTERGLLAPADLYRALTLQLEEIILDLLGWETGEYLLAEGPLEQPSHLKLQRRTRELCVEGARRQAELQRLRRLVPGSATLAAKALGPTVAAWIADGAEARLRVEEAYQRSGLRESEALGKLAEAAAEGSIALIPLAEQPPTQGTGGIDPFDAHSRALRLVFETLRRETGVAQEGLNSFFLEPPQGFDALMEGLSFGPDGGFPLDELRARAEKVAPGARGRARALEGLEALLSFCLFESRNVLSPGA
ncbi:MAG: DUF4388 domain-containing protein, partial [Deltaproteobacteria bacterium]